MRVTCSTLPAVAWHPPAGLARPGARQALVLRGRVAAFGHWPALAPGLLPPGELARAGRYLHPADRLRFVVARVALRALLGQWLGVAPAAVPLAVGAQGKPFLAGEPALHFSLAHTRTWVLLAVAAAPLGIDTEALDPGFPFEDILAASFSAAEQAAIAQAPDPRRQFYQLWTRKESLVKATGQGIDDSLPGLPVLDGRHLATGAAGSSWRICSFAVAGDHPAALAYPADGTDWELAFYELTPHVVGARPGAGAPR